MSETAQLNSPLLDVLLRILVDVFVVESGCCESNGVGLARCSTSAEMTEPKKLTFQARDDPHVMRIAVLIRSRDALLVGALLRVGSRVSRARRSETESENERKRTSSSSNILRACCQEQGK